MKLLEAYNMIKAHFTSYADISLIESINQAGEYLYFDSVEPKSKDRAVAKFVLIISAKSLNKDTTPAILLLENLLGSIFDFNTKACDIKADFKGIKAASFESSNLYIYAAFLHIEISL